MANIIRIRNLEREHDLNNILIPVDKREYGEYAKVISIDELKAWILSGYTPACCTSTTTMSMDCTLEGTIECDPCILEGEICYLFDEIECVT